jgi:hypothetical protein
MATDAGIRVVVVHENDFHDAIAVNSWFHAQLRVGPKVGTSEEP